MLRTIGWILLSYCVVGTLLTFIAMYVYTIRTAFALCMIHEGLDDQWLDYLDNEVCEQTVLKMADDWREDRIMTKMCCVLYKLPIAVTFLTMWPATYYYWCNYCKPLLQERKDELVKSYNARNAES